MLRDRVVLDAWALLSSLLRVAATRACIPGGQFPIFLTSIHAFVCACRAAAHLLIFSAYQRMDDEGTRDSRKVCQTECPCKAVPD